jgi:hypothetical protein
MWIRYMKQSRAYAFALCVAAYSFGTCEYILTWVVDVLDQGQTTELKVFILGISNHDLNIDRSAKQLTPSHRCLVPGACVRKNKLISILKIVI